MTTRIAKTLFATAVTFIAVAPRMPFDSPFSIGGNLSSGFRKVLLILTVLFLVKQSVTLSLVPKLIVLAFESIIEAFLGLLTPYLLRLWLSNRVNFPGDGKGLSKWIYAVAALCFVGVTGKATSGDDMWIFKKVADAITYVPTIATLRIYNTITSPGGQYPGRGSVLSQTVWAAEHYALLSHAADILAKLLHLSMLISDERYQEFIEPCAINSFFATFTRILCHSILINSLDESFHFRPSSEEGNFAGAASSNNNSANENKNDDAALTTALVELRPSRV
jgi:hypothetical protein